MSTSSTVIVVVVVVVVVALLLLLLILILILLVDSQTQVTSTPMVFLGVALSCTAVPTLVNVKAFAHHSFC